MKDSIRRKLERLDERFEEISRLLSDPGVISRQNEFRELSMEYARLGGVSMEVLVNDKLELPPERKRSKALAGT